MLERTRKVTGLIGLLGFAVWVPMTALHQFTDLKLNMQDDTSFWLVTAVYFMCVGGFLLSYFIDWLNRRN